MISSSLLWFLSRTVSQSSRWVSVHLIIRWWDLTISFVIFRSFGTLLPMIAFRRSFLFKSSLFKILVFIIGFISSGFISWPSSHLARSWFWFSIAFSPLIFSLSSLPIMAFPVITVAAVPAVAISNPLSAISYDSFSALSTGSDSFSTIPSFFFVSSVLFIFYWRIWMLIWAISWNWPSSVLSFLIFLIFRISSVWFFTILSTKAILPEFLISLGIRKIVLKAFFTAQTILNF